VKLSLQSVTKIVDFISECALTVLNGNINLTDCDTRKLQKYKAALRNVYDRRVSLASKKKLIVQRRGFLLPLLSAILTTVACLIFRNR